MAESGTWQSLVGSMRRVVDRRNVDLNWNGTIVCRAEEPPYALYRARFDGGTLVAFEPLDAADPQCQRSEL